jgi:light-regulated signal transduction histidine kinase (bacteriophytochrome)
LRTPLRAINGFSYALARDYADKLDARALDDLQRVRAASQRMGQLIDDMVRLLHISRVEMHWGEVDLSRLATEVGADFSQAEPERAVRLTIAPDCRVQGDTALLRIVLENALGNAWKYTRTTPEPTIEFGRMGEGAGATYFVRDNGCGFDMNYVHKLFGAFQRLHASEEYPGTGIGLACIRRVVQRHGGKTWIEGEIDRGTTLYFTLPGNNPASSHAPAA